MSTPYAVSSDLVSAYPAKSLAIAQFIDGYKTSLAMVQNTQTGTSYTFALADFTKLVTLNNAAAVAVTLPLEATVAWETGTQLRLVNLGAGTVTVAGAVGVTINGTPLTLAQYKGANLIKTGTNTWVFVPFASSIGAAVYSDANTGTYTGYAYKTFSASGTLNVTQAGFATLVIVGGGGGGGSKYGGGGGGGGSLQITDAYLPVGTLTVTVGAGGAASTADAIGTSGEASRIGSYFSPGGGNGGGNAVTTSDRGDRGASGGGGQYAGGIGGGAISGLGFAGGTAGGVFSGGGGGGASAVGAAGVGGVGGNGGAGTTTNIGGTTPTGAYVAGNYSYGGGGGGGANTTAGTGGSGGGANGTLSTPGGTGSVNTGGGGGGAAAVASNVGGPGGSGIVIVRVAV